MNYQLSGDPTVPAAPFVRQIAPADIDIVAAAMADQLRKYHDWGATVWPFTDAWRVIGFDNGAIVTFLQRYVLTSRDWKISLTLDNWSRFADELQGLYNYSDADISDYLRAMLDTQAAGLMKDTIIKPYTYTPTTPLQDIQAAAKTTAKTAAWAGAGLLIAAGVVYFIWTQR